MKIHTDWTSRGFSLAPVARAIGPFCMPDFLSTLWGATRQEGAELIIAESSDALLALTISGGTLGFVGDRDLIDYRSPLGPGSAELISGVVGSQPSGTRISFDSLPVEAVEPVAAGLSALGLSFSRTVHEVAAVLSLPPSFDGYLDSIGKKERHELRRKRRRYEAQDGPLELRRVTGDEDVFRQFIDLHRRSEGNKGTFMTARLERYFAVLLELPGWAIDALLTGTGEVAAATIGYVDDDGYYLYNSAFDPDLRHLSPGQVLLGAMIERAIGEGRRIFDFLKGAESYKFRLGAVERPLYEIVSVR